MCWADPKWPEHPRRELPQSPEAKPRCRPEQTQRYHRAVQKNWLRVAKLPKPRKDPKDFGQTVLQVQHSQKVRRTPNLREREYLERPRPKKVYL